LSNPPNHKHCRPEPLDRARRQAVGILLVLLLALFPTPGQTKPLVLRDQVLSQDTTWSGEVEIAGVVVVGRRATLTIAPGSRISFRRLDRNEDKIGDGEIRVLGGITAEGTPEKPIIFASAEEPATNLDWSYLLIFTSSKLNRLAWCEFHNAFSGLQVHFSTATVRNCSFTGNHEGLRFGRADLVVNGSRFADNDIGIRFTRMEGPVVITGNEITGNRIGIFLVPSGQNIRDFFEPDRGGRPWNTGHLRISANNIHGNSWYNLDLGEKQFWNLDVSQNYWGSSDKEAISATIFDQRRDESLGLAIFEPYAPAPFPPGGDDEGAEEASKP
jgi:parallel beta-helix repeat protein